MASYIHFKKNSMGSLEEEELVQMVQEFMEAEPSEHRLPSRSKHLPYSKVSSLQEILRSGTDVERDVLEIVLNHVRSKKDVQRTSGLKKWLALKLEMDGLNAGLCQTCWATSSGCPAGNYEYIEIENEDGNTGRLIVDIDFRSQFELARPSLTYKELTDALPSIFVGSEEKLKNIISVVCTAAKQSFREAELHVPPWRTTAYMHSKWLSTSRKVGGSCSRRANREHQQQQQQAKASGRWAPPVKARRQSRDLGRGGSALSSQFSNMGINCC